MKTKYLLPSQEILLERMNLEAGGKVQMAVDAAVIKFCMPYVPMDTGTLMKSPYSVTKIGQGEVIYPGPYAHYMYYGEVYGPNIPIERDAEGNVMRWVSPPEKHPTGRQLQYDTSKNPLAGSFWFERMKADRLNDIIEEAKKYVNGK